MRGNMDVLNRVQIKYLIQFNSLFQTHLRSSLLQFALIEDFHQMSDPQIIPNNTILKSYKLPLALQSRGNLKSIRNALL